MTLTPLAASLSLLLAAAPPSPAPKLPDRAQLEKMAARFVEVPVRANLTGLSKGDRQALEKLVQAARVMDELYFLQSWEKSLPLLQKLRRDPSPLGQARLRYFLLMRGPWSELEEYAAFVPGVPARKPPQAAFYPEDMTRQEFEAWTAKLEETQRAQATGFFSVIRRSAEGGLTAVPYSEAYRPQLERAAQRLREAAAATTNESLAKFLRARADAFASNDYYASDVAWMDLDAPIEITIGPYETYNDELFGYKAAFEAYLGLRDDRESARLAALSAHLQDVENHLPIPDALKNPKLGAQAPIRVVDEVFASGDAAHGVKAAAYNLPNDERIIRERGSKRVMLKNVQKAKFDRILTPIADRVLARNARPELSFEAFFTHILAHELVHGIGPHQVALPGGKTSTPREKIQDLYSTIEEAKADVTGLFALQYLMDQAPKLGLLEAVGTGPETERRLYVTYLASAFRTLRFGATESHGQGMAVQLNWLLDRKAVVVGEDGRFDVDREKMRAAVRELAAELLMIEAKGDRAAAEQLLQKLATIRPEVQKALDGLKGLPVDIDPKFGWPALE